MSGEFEEVKRLGVAFRMEASKLSNLGHHPELVARGQMLALLHGASTLFGEAKAIEWLRMSADSLERDVMAGMEPFTTAHKGH